MQGEKDCLEDPIKALNPSKDPNKALNESTEDKFSKTGIL